MTKNEIKALVASKIAGQGMQVDAGGTLPAIFYGIIDLMAEDGSIGDLTDLTTEHKNDLVSAINEIVDTMAKASQVGDLADLATDHKSNLVSAINEIANLVDTPHLVVSLEKSAAELKAIYEEVASNLVVAKNIVFYNSNDELYYVVNGYNIVSDVLKLHAIMQGESGLADTIVNITSEGVISIG